MDRLHFIAQRKPFSVLFICLAAFASIAAYVSIPKVQAVTKLYTSDHSSIVTIGNLNRVGLIKTAGYHTCVVSTEQIIYCGGYNGYGQLGDNTIVDKTTSFAKFKLPSGSLGIDVSTAHVHYTCALTTEQQVYCTGRNDNGQLGDGTTLSRSEAVRFQLPGTKKATKIATNNFYYSSCALTTDQMIYCAGINNYSQLGNGNALDQPAPVQFQLPLNKRAVNMAVNLYHTCALTADLQVYCSGFNGFGALGDTTTAVRTTPNLQFQIPGGIGATSIGVGFYHTCAIASNQQVYCAGYNLYGQLGDNTSTNQPTPVRFQLPPGKNAQSIVTSSYHTCALTTSQEVYCSGYNLYGQLGDNSTLDRVMPVLFQLPEGRKAMAVTSNYLHTCVLTNDRLVYCSGYNPYGALGDNSTVDRSLPVQFQIPGGKKAMSVKASTFETCVSMSDLTNYCSGYNAYGQLGTGTPSTSVPLPLAFTAL